MRTHRPHPPTSDDLPQLLEPGHVLRILALSLIVGGVFTLISTAIPHPYMRYNPQFFTLGFILLVAGPVVLRLSHRHAVDELGVQACCGFMSVAVLTMSWLGMADLAGIQSIFLILLLGISALLGPGIATWALLAGQSAGYAVVLATSNTALALDQLGQWLTVTMGLVVCVLCMRAIRARLEQSARHDAIARDERAHERQQYAMRLERVNAELREAVELKGRFVAMASHELRTPLTVISGFATTMTTRWDSLSDAELREFVGIIEDQSARLSRLVSDLLTLSRIESGRVRARPQRLQVCEQVARILRDLGMEDDVTVTCDPTLEVKADEGHLQQILINYLTNARAYGQAPYSVEARRVGAAVQLIVSDAGSGVEEAFVPVLFERFTRNAAPVQARRDANGTGLGLSIVEGLAHAHGGYAWYEPNDPIGSRFGVSLPTPTA